MGGGEAEQETERREAEKRKKFYLYSFMPLESQLVSLPPFSGFLSALIQLQSVSESGRPRPSAETCLPLCLTYSLAHTARERQRCVGRGGS